MEVIEYLDNIPDSMHRPRPHYQQKSFWDCGISCFIMILDEKDRKWMLNDNNIAKVCADEGFAQSTWTIDLCYLLKKFRIPFLFTTITKGVDPNYSEETYYDKVLQKDTERVIRRFEEAERNCISVQERSVPLSEIITHLAKAGPIIALVNANALRTFPSLDFSNYQGHYILVVGYDLQKKSIYFQDPSFKSSVNVASFAQFEKARKFFGTDEDIIFIYSKMV
uniref:Protein C22orf13 homolog n=1 Tax=Lepeophtheirus salmonis TaxID=72036 RepID=D3PI99_LEPSM|nr:protein C22orf13 homolog [Lepeophtheirus salmonis]